MRTILLALAAGCALAQAPKKKQEPIHFSTCVEPIAAYGEHVRFTTEEHIKLLLLQVRPPGESEYRAWEQASYGIDWFSGPKPVSLAYVKSHMPRAMLLTLRFPVDQNPHVNPADLKRLLETESAYESATKNSQAYTQELMKKYSIGPGAIFDEDFGGATPRESCGKWEESK